MLPASKESGDTYDLYSHMILHAFLMLHLTQ